MDSENAREDITQHELSDDRIKRMITDAIGWSPDAHYRHVRVVVEGAVVYLSGTVESSAEKTAAEDAAKRVPGVTQVINEIAVMPGGAMDNAAVEQNIRQILVGDARVDAEHIEVIVDQGIADVRGEAVTPLEKRAILDDVRSSYGVTDVVDEVQVLPKEPVNDHMLEETVVATLSGTTSLDIRQIHPHVQDGIVYLQGSVLAPYLKTEAEHVVEGIPGVRAVVNELKTQFVP